MIIASSSIPPVPADAFDGWPEAARLRAAGDAVWANDPEPSPRLTRAAAITGAPANVWRPQARAEYLSRLRTVRFSADWALALRAGVLPPARPENSQARLASLGTPILLLHGRQDMTFPVTLAEDAATEMANARAVILDQAGHMAHIDDPRGWLTAVTSFLAEG